MNKSGKHTKVRKVPLKAEKSTEVGGGYSDMLEIGSMDFYLFFYI